MNLVDPIQFQLPILCLPHSNRILIAFQKISLLMIALCELGCFLFLLATLVGFTTMVANKGLEKAPWDRRLNVPSKELKGNLSPQYLGHD